jgi:hypothetical protein
MADAYVSNPDKSPLPIFVRLNSLISTPGSQPGSSLFDLLPDNFKRLKNLEGLIRRGAIVLILDGLDELPSGGPESHRIHLPSELGILLAQRCVVTCREAFHSLYVEANPIHHSFSVQMRLLPLDFEQHVVPFVQDFCRRRDASEHTNSLLLVLRRSVALRDLMSRALMMRMTTHVLLEQLKVQKDDIVSRLSLLGADYLAAVVYEHYIRDWLVREQRKADLPVLDWTEKLEIAQEVAFRIFAAMNSGKRPFSAFAPENILISQATLGEVVQTWLRISQEHGSRGDVLAGAIREVRERTFLLVSNLEERKYRFAHKSFYEFLLARHVVHQLSHQKSATEVRGLLAAPFPDEVINFIRELLHYCRDVPFTPFDRVQIEENLISLVRLQDSLPSELMARQQAANLVPIVAQDSTVRLLRNMVSSEVHPFVRRAIAVGIALHHEDSTLLDKFVNEMDVDPLAQSFHMGYNRIYYGDQSTSDTSFQDDGEAECSRFFRASVRHLQLPHYAHIKYMALASIGYMLDNPLRTAYLRDHDYEALTIAFEVCSDISPGGNASLQRRQKEVLRLLTEAKRQGQET